MQNYQLGGLDAWEGVDDKSVITFTPQTVKLTFNCSRHTEIYAITHGDKPVEYLLGSGVGIIQVQFTTDVTVTIQLKVRRGGTVMVRNYTPQQSIDVPEVPSFTTIQPRRKVNPEIKAIQDQVRLNELARQQEFDRQIKMMQDLQPKTSQQLIEPDPKDPKDDKDDPSKPPDDDKNKEPIEEAEVETDA